MTPTRTIAPHEWQAQPWKNGGGITREVVRWPAAGAYDVRVSVADVERSGPFSTFPGYRRWSFLLGAAPIDLGGRVLHAVGDGVELDGAEPIAARLLAGPTTLLNVLARPGTHVGRGRPGGPVRGAFHLGDRTMRLFEPTTTIADDDVVWIA